MLILPKSKRYKKILVIPDAHAPWVHWGAVCQAHRWAEKHNPDLVIQLGDLTDQKIWSRWQSDPDDYSPSEEFDRACTALERISTYFPNMIILTGNHDERIRKRAIESGIPGEMFKDFGEYLGYDGWVWCKRNDQVITDTQRGKILFQHGDEMGGTVAAKSRRLGMSYVQGHTHKTSITYTHTPLGHFFGAEFGCVMDVNSKAATYAQANPVGVSIGFGVIKYGIPYFISYERGGRV